MKLEETLFQRIGEDWTKHSPAEILGFITPKISQSLGLEGLEKALSNKLKVKFGIDPTGSQIHIGHIVPILLLSIFQKAGHDIDFIVGDFTAMVGDPSGRDTGRSQLSQKDIEENMSGFVEQAGKYIRMESLMVHHNSSWLNPLSLSDLLGHLQKMNASTVMQREDFRKRAENGQAVSVAELLYGVLMGFDSLALKSDVEIGGVDQLLNIAQCREMMVNAGLPAEIGLFTPIIEGTDGTGRKMSKSFGNVITVDSSLEEKFGKVMSIPDSLILPWFKAFTYIHTDEIAELESFIEKDPLAAKKMLAVLLIALETKDLESGIAEQKKFESIFSERTITAEDCEAISAEKDLFTTLRPHFSSNSELNRLFEQRAVRTLDDEILSPDSQVLGMVRAGKRRFFNIAD
jgi:tyrosyl-tRNA synthetase